MASRSKKKNSTELKVQAKNNVLLERAKENREKLARQVPFIMLVGLVLIVVCFCLPLTGVNVRITASELNEMIGGTQSSENPLDTADKYTEYGSSLSMITIMLAPINMKSLQGDQWLSIMTNKMIEESTNKELMTKVVENFVKAKYTQDQIDMFATAMNIQLIVSYIFVGFWLVLLIMSVVVRSKGKGVLALLVVSGVFALISFVEMITLMVISLAGMAGASFITNVGAYLMTIVSLAMCVLLVRSYVLLTKQNKEIKELQA